MVWLRIGCASIAFVIYLYLALQTLHFKKEFKGAIQEDRTLSEEFANKWEKKLSRNTILIIIATLLGLVAVLITDLK
jgi:uncharacterized membrane protein